MVNVVTLQFLQTLEIGPVHQEIIPSLVGRAAKLPVSWSIGSGSLDTQASNNSQSRILAAARAKTAGCPALVTVSNVSHRHLNHEPSTKNSGSFHHDDDILVIFLPAHCSCSRPSEQPDSDWPLSPCEWSARFVEGGSARDQGAARCGSRAMSQQAARHSSVSHPGHCSGSTTKHHAQRS
jgi:hypothetical protein